MLAVSSCWLNMALVLQLQVMQRCHITWRASACALQAAVYSIQQCLPHTVLLALIRAAVMTAELAAAGASARQVHTAMLA